MSGTSTEIKHRSLLELNCHEARAYFLKGESYCNIELPDYFSFENLLSEIDGFLSKKKRKECAKGARDCEKVNHVLVHNKDGQYAWRPFQLIHPVLYVDLIRIITEDSNWKLIRNRFQEFAKEPSITCLSLPLESLTPGQKDKAAQVKHWWADVEQKSIGLALDFEYLFQTDISDCYSSIYTHSIAWALHSKEVIKSGNNRNDLRFVGNAIDEVIRDMCHGQTNGIPQGSAVMDFIAEMVLGYADSNLLSTLRQESIGEYKILRYRDDYRIFVNNPRDGEIILKSLTSVLAEMGHRLNPTKTKFSRDVIHSSVKKDKLSWKEKKFAPDKIQDALMQIHIHSKDFPHSGSISSALQEFYIKTEKVKMKHLSIETLISIVIDIAFHNPRCYAIVAAIISRFLSLIPNNEDQKSMLNRILKRFKLIPNTGHLQLWLQRVANSISPEAEFGEVLCIHVRGGKSKLWNSDWITSPELLNIVDTATIVSAEKRDKAAPVIPPKEVALFQRYTN